MTYKEYKERIAMVKAMELIARTINDETILNEWLAFGIADGDITEKTSDEEIEFYIDDERYADLMDTFLCVMSVAFRNGGLCSDGVVSKAKK